MARSTMRFDQTNPNSCTENLPGNPKNGVVVRNPRMHRNETNQREWAKRPLNESNKITGVLQFRLKQYSF